MTMLYFHGTKSDNIDSILRTGLKTGFGWGAESPGVFLSHDFESAMRWAETKSKESGGSPAVLSVEIPESATANIIPRKTSFALPGDVQYLGEIPSGWIKVTNMSAVAEALIRDLVRETLLRL